jgi:CheY-like chemotaxis protein
LSFRPATVLLVDDDIDVREVSAGMLEELGYSVVQASGGVEALEIVANRQDLDVMVTDVRMPGMSGLELSEQASKVRADLKVILISGYFRPQTISRRFLQKPFRTRDLDAAIRAELAS